MNSFSTQIKVRWADVDSNQHVRHSAYYDYGAHCRIQFFIECGFPLQKFQELGIGPILFHEECSFLKEIKMEETITINLLKGEIRDDGSRWALHHEIFNSKNEKCAHIIVKGAWMDLTKRKLTLPPEELAEKFLGLEEKV